MWYCDDVRLICQSAWLYASQHEYAMHIIVLQQPMKSNIITFSNKYFIFKPFKIILYYLWKSQLAEPWFELVSFPNLKWIFGSKSDCLFTLHKILPYLTPMFDFKNCQCLLYVYMFNGICTVKRVFRGHFIRQLLGTEIQ